MSDHAGLNDGKMPDYFDGGREGTMAGAVVFLLLAMYFATTEVTFLSFGLKFAIVVFVPMLVVFFVLKRVSAHKKCKFEKWEIERQAEQLEMREKQILEAKARGGFDRWKKDE